MRLHLFTRSRTAAAGLGHFRLVLCEGRHDAGYQQPVRGYRKRNRWLKLKRN